MGRWHLFMKIKKKKQDYFMKSYHLFWGFQISMFVIWQIPIILTVDGGWGDVFKTLKNCENFTKARDPCLIAISYEISNINRVTCYKKYHTKEQFQPLPQ